MAMIKSPIMISIVLYYKFYIHPFATGIYRTVMFIDMSLTLGSYVSHVLVDVCDELLAYRYVVANAELIVHCLPWHSLLLLDYRKNLIAFACQFELADGLSRLKQCAKHALLCR